MDPYTIVVVLPPYFAVSKNMGYGGTEKVALAQISALANLGHKLVVFAKVGSEILHNNVQVIQYETNGFDLQKVHANESIAVSGLIFAQVEEYIGTHQVDIIMDHTEGARMFWYNHPQARKVVIQAHNDPARFGAMDALASRHMNVVAISFAQKTANPKTTFKGIVYHGLPASELLPVDKPRRDYLAFLGRFDREKGICEAITVARSTGLLLKVAAPLREIDRPLFESVVQPAIDEGVVEYLGEVDMAGKQELLANAAALLALPSFREPFGLYVIEAFACGTPVIAFEQGALPELVSNGLNGFVSSMRRDQDGVILVDEVVACVQQLHTIDRRTVRRTFQERFTDVAMAQNLIKLFGQITGKKTTKVKRPNVGLRQRRAHLRVVA